MKFTELEIVIDQVEPRGVEKKTMEKSASQKSGYTTLKELRQMQENTESMGNIPSTPVSTPKKKKKSYFEKLAEENAA